MLPADLVKRVVKACRWEWEGKAGEGMLRLMRGGSTGEADHAT
jgi:hypothetical protein